MKVLSIVKDYERELWEREFLKLGHEFHFLQTSTFDAFSLYNPDLVIYSAATSHRALTNCLREHTKVKSWNIDRRFMLPSFDPELPTMGSTFYIPLRYNCDIAIFGAYEDSDLMKKEIRPLLSRGKNNIRIYSDTKWGFPQYCGFLRREYYPIAAMRAKRVIHFGKIDSPLPMNLERCRGSVEFVCPYEMAPICIDEQHPSYKVAKIMEFYNE